MEVHVLFVGGKSKDAKRQCMDCSDCPFVNSLLSPPPLFSALFYPRMYIAQWPLLMGNTSKQERWQRDGILLLQSLSAQRATLTGSGWPFLQVSILVNAASGPMPAGLLDVLLSWPWKWGRGASKTVRAGQNGPVSNVGWGAMASCRHKHWSLMGFS